MRAELLVSEDQIAEVMEKYEESLRDPSVGKVRGRLAALGHAGRYFDFVVERITPVAIPSEGKNVFPVRVKLLKPARWMQPGMTGVAEIHIDRRPYAYIWTRRLVNWIRMKLWL